MPTSKSRPRNWNDDVIWLLSRALGLLHTSGAGTSAAAVPRGLPASPVIHRVRAAHITAGPATELTIQLPLTTRTWELVRWTYHRTAGSAVTMQPRIGQAAAFVAGSADEVAVVPPQPVGVGVFEGYIGAHPIRADANCRIYLRPGFDAGADNAGLYQIWLRQVFETEETT